MRAGSPRAMKKREAVTRETAASHMLFPSLTACARSAAPTGAEHNGISSKTAIAPAQWDKWRWSRLIYAKPKTSYDVDGVCELRVRDPPCE